MRIKISIYSQGLFPAVQHYLVAALSQNHIILCFQKTSMTEM